MGSRQESRAKKMPNAYSSQPKRKLKWPTASFAISDRPKSLKHTARSPNLWDFRNLGRLVTRLGSPRLPQADLLGPFRAARAFAMERARFRLRPSQYCSIGFRRTSCVSCRVETAHELWICKPTMRLHNNNLFKPLRLAHPAAYAAGSPTSFLAAKAIFADDRGIFDKTHYL